MTTVVRIEENGKPLKTITITDEAAKRCGVSFNPTSDAHVEI